MEKIEVKGLIIREVFGGFEAIPKEFESQMIVDARKIKHFEKRNGFETMEDVVEYIEKWF